MNLYEELLSHLFGLSPRNKKLAILVPAILLVAALATHINFIHALVGYGDRKASTFVKGVLRPELKTLQEPFDKQMEKAREQQMSQTVRK